MRGRLAEYEVDGEGTIIAGNQFKRTEGGAKLEQRIEEIGTIAKYLSERADRALGQDRALILLGDFNIVSPEHLARLAAPEEE